MGVFKEFRAANISRFQLFPHFVQELHYTGARSQVIAIVQARKYKAEVAALSNECPFLYDTRDSIAHSKGSFYGRVPRAVPQCLPSSVLSGISKCARVKLFIN